MSPAPQAGRETRAAARLAFARTASHDARAALEAASEDASARSYWRVHGASGTAVLMDAPEGSGDLGRWLDVDARLRAAGLHAPEVLARDRAQGFLLLSDLGTRSYLSELNDATADSLYSDALGALLAMQTRIDAVGLPQYGETLLTAELELLPKWFLQRHLGIAIGCDEWDIVELAFRLLIDNARAQPQVFVHRDYHSRNLLVVPGSNPGIVDLQDAVLGPVTYDLVSLLRDCYITWDDARVRGWAEAHRQHLIEAGALDGRIDPTHWRRWFDLMGVQRHLKVLGIFCRLWYRDGKRRYLADLPRVWQYVRSVASDYPELHDFLALLERWVGERDLTAPAA
ncbi:MAG TPA: phosphotransferase [Rhodanobacteraceae bacterium]|nr:phosphotransferase [Rhodanobacteraceae bacterium]